MNKKENISKVLKELGVPAHLKGYHYIRYAAELLIDDISLIGYMTGIYCDVAEKFDDTPSRVERAIRNAIEVGWRRANVVFANKMFGYTVDSNKGKPTNSEFIVTVADYILMTRES